jgi:Ni/Fe-hydrogenase subunit HybB-like protein
MINRWQRGVPLVEMPFMTHTVKGLLAVGLIGLVLSVFRVLGGLGFFSDMNDAYAWGIWKTFNVMTLTALGSGGFAVGLAAWVSYKKDFHLVMRVALLTSFLFYMTGLLAIMIDVGRPWNFWNVLLPWRWNTESALLEVSICMPLYACVFLAFENLPPLLETLRAAGSDRVRGWVNRLEPTVVKMYPWMVSGAYILPAMHQSSLGALLLLAGTKIHPLWQTQWLPLFYLIQAVVCGYSCVIFTLLVSCLYWRRSLDMYLLGELGSWMSWTSILFVLLRLADVLERGVLRMAFSGDIYSIIFMLENFLVLAPALALRVKAWRETPRVLFECALATGIGGMLYRFVPTTIAYNPGHNFNYFPSVIEVLITVGYVAIAALLYGVAVKIMPILPAPLTSWYRAVDYARERFPALKVQTNG